MNKSLCKLITLVLVLSIHFNSFAQEVNGRKLLDHLKYLSSDELAGRKPLSEGSLKAQNYILNELRSLKLVEPLYPDYIQRFSFSNQREKKTYHDAANLVAFIPGSRSKKVIVVTAHYDHVGIGKATVSGDSIYNGADDNASGTAALLVLAEYFSENRPQHGMLFVALDAEEMGLRGARALVNDFPYPLEQILVNVNMDMLSRSDKNELYISGTFHNPQFKPLLEQVANGSNPKLLFGHDEPGTGSNDWTKSSDHGAFFEKNVPHLYFGVEDHEDYHRPSDEFQNIDPEFFKNAVNLVLKSLIKIDKGFIK
jgi:Zn-dependent M28 family amino/carboxypeptidase